MTTTEQTGGRRMPVRTVDVSFSWEGIEWSATMRINAPSRVMDAFFGDTTASIKDALSDLVVGWDWVDEQGEPLPLPKDGGLGEAPYPLLRELVTHYVAATSEASAPPKESSVSTEPG